MVYFLILLVVGLPMAVIGAVSRRSITIAGGLVQGVAAVAFAYGATTKCPRTFLYGPSQLDLALEPGFFVLVIASGVSLSAALWR